MSKKILVAYGTRAGSTQEVAEAIGQSLRQSGAEVDVMPAQSVKDLSVYQAAVIGSGVRINQLYGNVVRMVKKYHTALSGIPVAYFVVCLTMREDILINRAEANSYLKPLYQEAADVKPVSVGLFAGVYDPKKLSFIMNFIMSSALLPPGDFRDWNIIRQWAEDLRPLFNL
jgi:menaquinone-dependent protoporphyrinogen oxidase